MPATERKRPKKRRVPRSYSREFTPRGAGHEYKLNRIPEELWQRVQKKALRDGVSLRALILTQLRAWSAGAT